MKRVVLVGGGHSHVQVLTAHRMRPFDAEVVVVVDRPTAVYSGMVPGFVAGQYKREEVEIDVWALARACGARIIVATVQRVDAKKSQIILRNRPPLAYDFCSLNVGSTVAGQAVPGVVEHAVASRPIADLVSGIHDRLDGLPAVASIVVVGAGAAGTELAFCVHHWVNRHSPRCRVTLVGKQPPVSGRPGLVAAIAADAAQRNIEIVLGSVTEVREAEVILADGRSLPAQLTFWVPGAAGHAMAAGLPIDPRGFIWVDDDLKVEGSQNLFAVGDCAVLRSWPEIPKAGVYAVRQGPVLAENIRRALQGQPLTPYVPQRDFLGLLNLGDGSARAAKWGQSTAGSWAMWWKDRIDRRFMAMYQVEGPDGVANLAPMEGADDMLCGGCAAKVGRSTLEEALMGQTFESPPGVLLGMREADDAVAVEAGDQVMVANVDVLAAFCDDPWWVGRVAVVNAVSDLLAKNATPQWAMLHVDLPAGSEDLLSHVLAGARAALADVGATLLGGHTTSEGTRLSVGVSVWGYLDGPLWRQDGLQIGDHLVLTRPIGTGVLLRADMLGRRRGVDMVALLEELATGNRVAREVAQRFPIHACTDITGFGLAGHAGGMARKSGCSLTVHGDLVPALPGALQLLTEGVRSTSHEQNEQASKAMRVEMEGPGVPLLFDPQTAGGLLLGVSPESSAALVSALRAEGLAFAVVIGCATARDEALITVRDTTGW
jgi:selenide, water dikinase